MKLNILWVSGLLLISGGAWAEGNCPPGQYPIGDARAPGCAPIPNYQGGDSRQQIPPPPPTGEWIKTWGAIAVARNKGGNTGVAVGKLSKPAAEQEAVRQCEGLGGGCEVSMVYQNQCVVISDPSQGGGDGTTITGADPAKISATAVNECIRSNNGAPCKVVYSACSDPIYRNY